MNRQPLPSPPTPTHPEDDRFCGSISCAPAGSGPPPSPADRRTRLRADALDALPDMARAAGVWNYQLCPEGVVAAELKPPARPGAHLIPQRRRLSRIAARSPTRPPILWVSGRCRAVRPVDRGRRCAQCLLAWACAWRGAWRRAWRSGSVVVSGLARGIDAAAHAASAGTGTIAVQAGGVDMIYPAENAELAARSRGRAARVGAAHGPATDGAPFPTRNRIVSGLCRAVVVVEAAAKSGSLITARERAGSGARGAGRARPPHGCARGGLQHADPRRRTLVRSAADVIEAAGTMARRAHPAMAAPAANTVRRTRPARLARALGRETAAAQTDPEPSGALPRWPKTS